MSDKIHALEEAIHRAHAAGGDSQLISACLGVLAEAKARAYRLDPMRSATEAYESAQELLRLVRGGAQ